MLLLLLLGSKTDPKANQNKFQKPRADWMDFNRERNDLLEESRPARYLRPANSERQTIEQKVESLQNYSLEGK